MSFHGGMRTRVLDEEQSSEAFQVTNGVKNSCVLVPIRFSMVFSDMLKTAVHNETDSMAIRYRSDKKLFNRQVSTKVKERGCVTCYLLMAAL